MKGKKGGTKMVGGVTRPTPAVTNAYSGGSSNVAKEARNMRKDGGAVPGKAAMMRLDRPGRKRGGAVGADCSPLSSAAKTESPSLNTKVARQPQ